jgi:hypothetical protein
MRSYRVSFFANGRNPDTGKGGTQSLGSIVIDMKPNDPMTIEAKAFRQGSGQQQLANQIKIQDLGVWGAKDGMKRMDTTPVEWKSGVAAIVGQQGGVKLVQAKPDWDAGKKIVASMGADLAAGQDKTVVQTVGLMGVETQHKVKAAPAPLSAARQAHLDDLKAELKYKPREFNDQPREPRPDRKLILPKPRS